MTNAWEETWYFWSYEGVRSSGSGRHEASVCNQSVSAIGTDDDAKHECVATAMGATEEEALRRAKLLSQAPGMARYLYLLTEKGLHCGECDVPRYGCPQPNHESHCWAATLLRSAGVNQTTPDNEAQRAYEQFPIGSQVRAIEARDLGVGSVIGHNSMGNYPIRVQWSAVKYGDWNADSLELVK